MGQDGDIQQVASLVLHGFAGNPGRQLGHKGFGAELVGTHLLVLVGTKV